MKASDWKSFEKNIHSCTKCPRLYEHCKNIGKLKRKSFLNEKYWARPVSGFGDTNAKLIIIGLAPAAHGANRTGRMFTGDRSGDWLYRALYKAGFANQALSTHQKDGLQLSNAYITSAAKCAPPDNKPTKDELKQCSMFLDWELEHLTKAKVYLGLGKIGFDQIWNYLKPKHSLQTLSNRPQFSHGSETQLTPHHWLIGSYHPSQQNTFTKKLTEPMFDAIFHRINQLLHR